MKKTSSSNNNTLSRSARRRRNRRKRQQSNTNRPNSGPLGSQSGRLTRPVAQNLTSSQETSFSPLHLFQVKAGSTPGGLRISGREYLGSVLNDSAQSGRLGFTYNLWNTPVLPQYYIPIRPASLMRAQAYAAIFEEYFFHKIKISFSSALPTTTAGALALNVEFDEDSALPSAGSFGAVANHMVSTVGNVYSDASMEFPGRLANYNRYFTHFAGFPSTTTDERMSVQCDLTGVCSTSLATSLLLGHITIEYDLELYSPIESITTDNLSVRSDIELLKKRTQRKVLKSLGGTDPSVTDASLEEETSEGSTSPKKALSVPLGIYEDVVQLMNDYYKQKAKKDSDLPMNIEGKGTPTLSRKGRD